MEPAAGVLKALAALKHTFQDDTGPLALAVDVTVATDAAWTEADDARLLQARAVARWAA